MGEDFNPYHEWLGFDCQLSHPNYYQLLGVTPTETNTAKISVAADRALARVRSFRPGPHAAQWSRLLDEIAAAKRCLTDAKLRAAYDGQPYADPTDSSSRPVRPAPRPRSRQADIATPAATPTGQSPAAPVVPMNRPRQALPMAAPSGSLAQPRAPGGHAGIPAAIPVTQAENVPVAIPLAAPASQPAGSTGRPASAVRARRRQQSNSFAFLAGTIGIALLLIATGLLLMLLLRSHEPSSPNATADRHPAGTDLQVRRPPGSELPSHGMRGQEKKPVEEHTSTPHSASTPIRIPPIFAADSELQPPLPVSDAPRAEVPVSPASDATVPPDPTSPTDPSEPTNPEPAIPPTPAAGLDTAPTPNDIRAVEQALSAARAALQNQQFDQAFAALERTKQLPMSPQLANKYERLHLLAQYARNFQTALRDAIAGLQGGDDIPVGSGNAVGFVEASRGQVTLRVAGANRVYAIDDLPAGLAIAIADRQLKSSDPVSLVMKAAYLATRSEPRDDWRSQAREWFREAAAGGVEIGDLEKVVDDRP